MYERVVLLALFVGSLFAFAPTAALASEAPVPEVSVAPPPDLPTAELPKPPALDLHLLQATRGRWWTGLALGLTGTAVGGVGAFFGAVGLLGDNGIVAALGLIGLVGGGGMALLGAGLSISGGWANAAVLRRGGIDVSMGLAMASLVTPLACVAVGFVLVAFEQTSAFAGVLMGAGYLSAFALSGAQLLHDGNKLEASGRLARGPALIVAPMHIGKSPGVAIAGRW